jgi:AcrR family transcriptional regulator
MSQVAEEPGIGRATLYKYFPDVEAILLAWHERHVAAHLEYLSGFANQPGVTAWARLVAVLDAYALIRHQHHDTGVAAFVHQVHALGAAATLRTKTAVHRLVAVVLAGLQPEALAISTDPPGAAAHKR